MISVGGQPAVLYRGDHRPATLTEGSRVVFAPTATTVTGEGGVTINHTYNDKIDVLKIYGKCVQDGTPSPDNPVEIQSVGGTLTVRNADGTQEATLEIPTLYGVGDVADVLVVDRAQGRAWVERRFMKIYPGQIGGDEQSTYRIMNNNVRLVGKIGYYSPYPHAVHTGAVMSNYQPWIGRGTTAWTVDASNIFISVSYNMPFSFSHEVLGTTSSFSKEECLDAFYNWVETADPVFETVYEVRDPTIEELPYTPLPTYPNGTVIEVESDVVPVVEVTTRTADMICV